MSNSFVFPFDQLSPDDPVRIKADTNTELKYNPDSGEPDQESAAAVLEGLARSTAAEILLGCGFSAVPTLAEAADNQRILKLAFKLQQRSFASSEQFMAALLGHFGVTLFGIVQAIFYADGEHLIRASIVSDTSSNNQLESLGSPTNLLTVFERLFGANPKPTPLAQFRTLASHLLKSDVLHQGLLRAQRALVRDFSSPFAQTKEILPGFAVFDEETGLAKPAFKRRDLDPQESLHPILHRVDYSKKVKWGKPSDIPPTAQFGFTTDVAVGECSVVESLDMFKRGFNVFTTGLLNNQVPLGSDKAIVAGGAVSACLHPWPLKLKRLYLLEKLMRRVLGCLFVSLPIELVDMIEEYAGFVKKYTDLLDQALFLHLCGPTSPYSGSDIDIFFVCPKGSTDVAVALDHFPKVHGAVVQNRAKADVEKYISKQEYPRHWIFGEVEYDDPESDWFIGVRAEIEQAKAEADGHSDFKSFIDLYNERKDGGEKPNARGWNDVVKEGVACRLGLLWTVRTTNSVTVAGMLSVALYGAKKFS
ncbi:UNVERIFIED_CONTAM: hypothetical protein HDU68_010429 [Siphonaria sp. JEL0065]|nr:hypothetical protein HDU68_010429 [Siphonaria sp. JEL0065]